MPSPPSAASRPDLTLEMMLRHLVERYGWEEMGRTIHIPCFTHKPDISSSVEYLRRTAWARRKVTDWYKITVARQKHP